MTSTPSNSAPQPFCMLHACGTCLLRRSRRRRSAAGTLKNINCRTSIAATASATSRRLFRPAQVKAEAQRRADELRAKESALQKAKHLLQALEVRARSPVASIVLRTSIAPFTTSAVAECQHLPPKERSAPLGAMSYSGHAHLLLPRFWLSLLLRQAKLAELRKAAKGNEEVHLKFQMRFFLPNMSGKAGGAAQGGKG